MSMLWACGGEDDNPCAGVQCEYGVCDPDNGQCGNPNVCSDDTQCLIGYGCEDGQCVAGETCASDSDCTVGICEGEVCVNPNHCASNADCLDRTYCGVDGSCVADPCADLECAEGVCERGVGECVSARSCTVATQDTDCLAGEHCADGTCASAEDFCDVLECERGVCDFEASGCINAPECADDMACVEGFFCNDEGACQETLCDENQVDCPRGVCDASTGECVNPETCEVATDCLDGQVCVVEGDTGFCAAGEQACGEAGCPGNQVCEYDAAQKTATCVENPDEQCTDARDCVDGRVCDGKSCVDSTQACAADPLEPNDSAEEATDFQASPYVHLHAIKASLCDGDTDFFRYNVDSRQNPRDTLLVAVQIFPRHIGLAELAVKVRDDAGDVVVEGSPDEAGLAEFSIQLGVLDQGDYTVEVSAADGVASHGLDYELYINTVTDAALNACNGATALQFGLTTEGSTMSTASEELGSSCTAQADLSNEAIYQIEVDEPSVVTVTAEPLDEQKLSVSIRNSCLRDSTERACQSRGPAGAKETLEAILAPGHYYILVEGASPADKGRFELKATAVASQCTEADNTCNSERVSMICRGERGMGTQVCDAGESCSVDTGLCAGGQPGDTCAQATVIEDGFSATIQWSDYRAKLGLEAGACGLGGDVAAASEGSDAVYSVLIPPGFGLSATLKMADGESGVLYLLRGCLDASSSCAEGRIVNGDQSSPLTYRNDSTRAETFYLVADAAQEPAPSEAELEVHIGPPACEPLTTRCEDDVVELCNDIGTAYLTHEACNFGCNAGVCNPPPNQTCDSPVALEFGTTVRQSLTPYSADYDPGTYGCTGAEADGRDAVYSVTTTQAEQVVTVEVQADFDASIYTADTCDAAMSACLAGVDAVGAGEVEKLQFLADEPGEYLVIIDSKSGSTGFFEVTATASAPVCVPGSAPTCAPDQTGVLQYCNTAGALDDFACPSGACSDGACEGAAGDICFDAIAAKADGTVYTGDFQGTNNLHYGKGRTGQCFFQRTDGTQGADTFYRLDLNPGDLLTAHLTTNDSDARLFFVEDCSNSRSCVGGPPLSRSQSKSYLSENGGTVFAVVDRESGSPTFNEFSIEFEVTPSRVCAPETTRCVDTDTVEVCNLSGTGYTAQFDCPAGCAQGACLAGPPTASCANAPDVGDGVVLYGKFSDFSDVLPMEQSGCVDSYYSHPGPDAIYKVSMQAGDVLNAELRSMGFDSPVLYVIDDCADAVNSCVAGSGEINHADYSRVNYVASTTQDVFVVATSSRRNAKNDFKLSIEKRSPECTPGTSECSADGLSLRYCNSNGVYETAACTSGVCSNSVCENPDGDICLEAIVLNDGDTVTGDWTGSQQFSYDAGRTGQCNFKRFSNPQGPDTFYQVDLQPGDVLRTELTSSLRSAVVYFLEDCTDLNSCVGSGAKSSNQTNYYRSVNGGPVRIVVAKNGTSSSTNTYELSVHIERGMVCSPGASSCLDANTVALCNESGTGYEFQQFCTGGCDNGSCDPQLEQANSCATAPLLDEGTYIWASFADLTNEMQIPQASCTNEEGVGRDLVYAVQVNAGQVLRARVHSPDDENPMVYITTDCADATGEACLAGETAVSHSTQVDVTDAEAAWLADRSGVVYVVVDSRTSNREGPFSLQIEKLAPECTPGEQHCAGDGSDTLKYCTAAGLYETYGCQGSCTAGACDEPYGDVCVDAIPLAPGDVIQSSYGDYVIKKPYGEPLTVREYINPGLGTCFVSPDFRQRGPDAVYAMELQAGQVVRATLTTEEKGAGMYVLDNCHESARDACLLGAGRERKFDFYAESTKTYYLVVDTDNSSAYYDFTLELETLTHGGSCHPGRSTCDPSTGQLMLCDITGQVQTPGATCADGCHVDRCAAPAQPNSTCADAYQVSGSTTLVDEFTRFSDDINFAADVDACGLKKRAADGNEAVYQVALEPGQYVEARVKTLSNDTYSPTVFIVSDCAAAETSCLAGEQGKLRRASAGYRATGAETVWVVVDGGSTYNKNYFELDLRIGMPECSDGESICDGDTRLVCTEYGAYEPRECSFGCDNNTGQCTPPPNDTCAGALVVPADGNTHQFSARIENYSNSYDQGNAPGGSCTAGMIGGRNTPGADAVYRVDMFEGDFLTVEFDIIAEREMGTNTVIWISDACPDIEGTCLGGVNAEFSGDAETLTFIAPETKSYWIVVDADDDKELKGDLSVKVRVDTASTCVPHTGYCSSQNEITYCNAAGTAELTYTCQGSCQAGTNGEVSCAPAAGDMCLDAIEVTASGSYQADMSAMTNALELPETACARTKTSGSDAIYKVWLNAGDSVEARVHPSAGERAVAYLLQNCWSATTDVPACLGASYQKTDGKTETVHYRAEESGYVYIVADSPSRSASGMWTVDIDIKPGVCEPGAALGCAADGNTLRYCDNMGSAEKTLTCAGGCDDSSGVARCAEPKGNVCADAIDATGGGSFVVDMGQMTSEYDMFLTMCLDGWSQSYEGMESNDVVFRLDVQAGDVITAQVLNPPSTDNPSFYLLQDCAAGSNSTNRTCIAGKKGGYAGADVTFTHTVAETGTLYLVADAARPNRAIGTWTVDIAIQSPSP